MPYKEANPGNNLLTSGPCLNINTVFPGVGIPMLKIRRLWDRLIIYMGMPILKRRHHYIETFFGSFYMAIVSKQLPVSLKFLAYMKPYKLVIIMKLASSLNSLSWYHKLLFSPDFLQRFRHLVIGLLVRLTGFGWQVVSLLQDTNRANTLIAA